MQFRNDFYLLTDSGQQISNTTNQKHFESKFEFKINVN